MDNILKMIKEEEVKWVKLGQLGKFYGGLVGKSKNDFINGNKYYVPYKNVFNNLSVDMNYLEKVQVYDIEKQKKLEVGDIIFTGSSENLKEAGLSSVITEKIEEDIYLNSFCFFYRLNDKNILLPNFSKYLFRSLEIRKQIIKCTAGVTRYNVSKKSMENIQIPIPSLELQEKIIKILDKYTDAYTKLQADLKKEIELRTKQYEYYKEMFLSQEYLLKKAKKLCGQDASLEWMKIGDVLGYEQPNKYIVGNTEYKNEYKTPVLTAGQTFILGYTNEENGIFQASKENPVIIFDDFTTSNHWVDFNFKVKSSAMKFLRLKTDEVLFRYCYYYMQIIKIDTTEHKRMWISKYSNIQIPIPPLEVQTHISSILDKYTSSYLQLQSTLFKEIEFRTKQYEYYRELLLSFSEI